MKIGIVTITDYDNYGNRLQNYALQEILKNLNHEVITIVNSPINSSNKLEIKLKSAFNIFSKLGFFGVLKKIREKNKENRSILEKKRSNFKNFSNEYIFESTFGINPNSIPNNLGEEFDFFIVGSDQVWNPNFRHGSPIDFLTFAESNKRIAYAPSFGVDIIEQKYVENYVKWINEFTHLSAREEAGAKIIYKLTSRKAPVVVDPTLLLTKEEWKKISIPCINKPKNQYILTYYLGNLSKEKSDWIESLVKNTGWELINLANYDDLEYFDIRPDEFIDLIESASLFLTDSFHGSIFSILMETPFVIFDRISHVGSMSSRIDTLLTTFKLEKRKWVNIDKENVLDVDFSHILEIQKKEINRSIEYLKKSLEK